MAECIVLPEAVLSHLSAKINEMKVAKAPFILSDFVKSIYAEFVTGFKDDARALANARLIPSIVKDIMLDDELFDYMSNVSNKELNDLIKSFNTGVTAVAEYVGAGKAPAVKEVQAIREIQQEKKKMASTPQVSENPATEDPEFDAKPDTFMSGTWNTAAVRTIPEIIEQDKVSYLEAKNKQRDEIFRNIEDPKMKPYVEFQKKIAQLMSIGSVNNDSRNIKLENHIGGIQLAFMDISQIPDDQKLPSIANEPTETKRKIAMVITDTSGNILYFNDKNEIVTKDTGKMWYQFLRTPPSKNADGTYNFSKSSVRTPSSIAKTQANIPAITKELTAEADDLTRIHEYIAADPANNRITAIITGGSKGYLEFEANERNPMIKVTLDEPFIFNVNTETATKNPGSVTFNPSNVASPPIVLFQNNLSGDTIDLLAAILTEDVKVYNEVGALVPMSLDEKRQVFDSLVAFNKNNKSVQVNITKAGISVVLKGETVDLTMSDAKEKILDVLNSAYPDLNSSVSLDAVKAYQKAGRRVWAMSDQDIKAAPEDDIVIQRDGAKALYFRMKRLRYNVNNDLKGKEVSFYKLNRTGDNVIAEKQAPVSYNNWVKDNSWITARPNADGKLVSHNGYFTYRVEPKELDKIYDRKADTNVIAQAQKANKSAITGLSKKLDSIDKINQELKKKGLKRNKLLQNKAPETVTQAQIDGIREWYKNHPMSKFLPFNEAFNMVNTEDPNIIGQFRTDSITLYKGSDMTDLYHEAWHGFEELFLTPEDKEALRSELKKIPGSFLTYKNTRVDFNKATPLELKEFIAEDFREFALSGGTKVLGGRPARNSIFKRIWNFLKALFGNTSINDVLATQNASDKLTEIYDKLRLGKLNEFTFDQKNAEFTVLNKLFVPVNKEEELPEGLDYNDGYRLMDMLDSWVANSFVLANLRTGLSSKALKEYYSLLSKDQLTEAEATTLRTIENQINDGRVHISEFDVMKSDYFRQQIYQELKERLIEKRAEFEDPKHADAKLLDYAIRQFGEVSEAGNPMSGEGVIATHLMNTRFLSVSDKYAIESEFEDDDTVSLEKTMGVDTGGNKATIRELSLEHPEILSIISGIQDFKVDSSRTMGIAPLMEDVDVINALARIFEGPDRSREVLYAKMVEAAKISEYAYINQILTKMGDPYNVGNNSIQRLWTGFHVVFNMPLIYLIQTTVNTDTKDNTNTSTVGKASSNDTNLKRDWKTGFYNRQYDDRSPLTRYILVDKSGKNYLNVPRLLKDFAIRDGNRLILDQSRALEFLQGVGIELDDTVTIRKELEKNRSKYGAAAIFQRLNTIRNWEIRNNKSFKLWNFESILEKNIVVELNRLTAEDPDALGILSSEYTFLTGEGNNVKNLLQLQLQFDSNANYSVSNPVGDTVQELSLPSTKSKIIDSINTAESYDALIKMPWMKYMALDRNYIARYSINLNSLFNMNTDLLKTDQGRGKTKLEMVNISGLTRTKNTSEFVHGATMKEEDMLSRGYTNLTQTITMGWSAYIIPADKSTNYGIGIKNKEYINGLDFVGADPWKTSGRQQFHKILLDYLSGELDRIDYLNSDEADPIDKLVVDKDGNSIYSRGNDFRIFDSVLRTSTKNLIKTIKRADTPKGKESLNDYFKKKENLNIREAIVNDINEYVDYLSEGFARNIYGLDFMDANLYDKLTRVKKKGSKQEIIPHTLEEVKRAAIEHTVTTAWIHNLEEAIMVFGDPMQWDTQDLSKRYSMFNSTGTALDNSPTAKDWINNLIKKNDVYHYAQSDWYDDRFGPAQLPEWTDHIKIAVIADPRRNSLYRDMFKKAYINAEKQSPAFKEGTKTEEQVEKEAERKAKNFDKMVIGDSAAFLTLDAYRILRKLNDSWSENMENLYKKIINKEQLKSEDLIEFFPLNKYQYAGSLEKAGVDAKALHKFTLMPLVPTVIEDTELEVLHNKMISQGISYAMFVSGSKKFNVTKDGTLDEWGQPGDTWYNPGTKKLAFNNKEYTFAPNYISLDYLKEQVKINSRFKNKSIDPSQQRYIIIDGVMDEAVPVDFKTSEKSDTKRATAWEALTPAQKIKQSPKYNLIENFRKSVDALVNIEINEIKREFGMKENGKFNYERFMLTVRREFDRSEKFGVHSKEFADTFKNKIKDFSLLPVAEDVEKMMVSYILKRIIGPKVNGEVLNLVSGVGFERVDRVEEQDLSLPEQYRKGTNGYAAPWRTEGKAGKFGSTHAGKVGIAFHPNFKSLLQMDDISGRKIGTRQRLNQMLISEEWLDTKNGLGTNRDLVTVIGPRIPTNHFNTMVFAEVSHFLPQEFGEKVIAYAELSPIAGSDNDGDNLKFQFPNLMTIDGKVQLAKNITKEKAEELHRLLITAGVTNSTALLLHRATKMATKKEVFSKEFFKNKLKNKFDLVDKLLIQIFGDEYMDDLKKLAEQDISDFETFYYKIQRKSVENNMLFAKRDLMRLPENFAALVTPNVTDNLEEMAKQVAPYTRNYQMKQTAFSTEDSKKVSPTKMLELPYHLYMQEVMKYFSKAIGISAVHNRSTPLMAFSGMYLKKNYTIRQGTKFYNRAIRFLLKHNTVDVDGEKYVSLSGIYDVNGKRKISDQNSEELGSVVDGSKKPFPADLLVSDYTLPITHLLTSAGVELQDRAWFVANPLVQQYVRDFVNAKSPIANLMETGGPEMWQWAKNFAREKVLSTVLNIPFDNQYRVAFLQAKKDLDRILNALVDKTATEHVMHYVMTAAENITKKPTTTLKLIQEGIRTATTRSKPLGVAGEIITFKGDDTKYVITDTEMLTVDKINDSNWIQQWSDKEGWTVEHFQKLKHEGAVGARPGSWQTTFKIATEEDLTPLDFSTENLKKHASSKGGEPTLMDKAVLLHYMQLEDMDSVKKLKINSNLDNKKKKNIHGLASRDFILNSIKYDSQLPVGPVTKYLDSTILGSFHLTDFVIDSISSLFPLRAHTFIREFLLFKASTGALNRVANTTYGEESDTIDQFFNQFMGALFQNSLRYFNINKLTEYKGISGSEAIPVKEIGNLEKHGIAIIEDADTYAHYAENKIEGKAVSKATIYIDKKALKRLYSERESNSYMGKGYMPLEDGTDISDMEFYHFTMEREYLRYTIPVKDVMSKPETIRNYEKNKDIVEKRADESAENFDKRMKKRAYEQYLRDKALDNIYLPWRLFNSSSSMSQRLKHIQESRQDLVKAYPILKVLKPIGLEENNKTGLKNILNRNTRMTKKDIDIYHENILSLQKSDDPNVSSFFNTLPYFAVFQSNYNLDSQFSLLKMVPDETLYQLMEKDSKIYRDLFDKGSTWLEENPNNSVAELFDTSGEPASKMAPSKKEAIIAFNRLNSFWERFTSANSIVKTDEEDDIFKKPSAFGIAAAKDPKVEKNRNSYTRKRFINWIGAFLPTQIKVAGPNEVRIPWVDQSPGVKVWNTNDPTILKDTVKAYPDYTFVRIDAPLVAETSEKKVAENKAQVDKIIANLKADSQTLVFDPTGYAKTLVGADSLTGNIVLGKQATAPKTFAYLSQQLFENFGYMNKNFMTKAEERTFKQRLQPATDDMVDALLNHCHITAAI